MTVHGEQIDDMVASAVVEFQLALTAEHPLLAIANGLYLVGKAAAMTSSPFPLSEDPAAKHLLGSVMQLFVDLAAPHIASEQIAFGMGCANALLIAPADEFNLDRILHLTLLLAALRTHLCRVEITRRGDPLIRNIVIRRAIDAPRDFNAPLQ